MKKLDLTSLPPFERRRFFQGLTALAATSWAPKGLLQEVLSMVVGAPAFGAEPTYFIEINLRDQFDIGHVFVAPGLATHPNLIRGDVGKKVALFDAPNTLRKATRNFYLTTEGRPLEPHLDNIAVIETCELCMGTIHNHEAANALRSPGRSYTAGAGRTAMWNLDEASKVGGNENHYSATPTPAVLHNYFVKQNIPAARNGIIYKGVYRAEHTVYHHSANLTNAQPDRYQSTDSLIRAFAGISQTTSTFLSTHGTALTGLISQVDKTYLERLTYEQKVHREHQLQLSGLEAELNKKTAPIPFNLQLSAAERTYWSQGVSTAGYGGPKAGIWEQVAYAAKLISNDIVRTVALEFCYGDIHGPRNEGQLRAQGTQLALPLQRLISELKMSGKFNNTIIAIYTTDGGRSPASDSWGSEGKVALVLAGGRIQGGYYGDIRVAGNVDDGHSFSYHRPDEKTGAPVPVGATNNLGRTSGASVWKTVAKAAGIPEATYNSYGDVRSAPELSFLLR